jgi:hypothetical protein
MFRDGSTELEIGEGTPAEEKEKIEQAFAEDGEDGLAGLGYGSRDTTYHVYGKLEVTDLTPEFVKKVKDAVACMEDMDDLQRVIQSIAFQSGITDDLKSELNNEALRAGLQFGADLCSFEDFCQLVSESSGDSTLKHEALQLIVDNAEDAHYLAGAATAAAEQLEDRVLATTILDNALGRAASNSERIQIVQAALASLGDRDRAKKALLGFEEEATSFDCRLIAEAVALSAEDRDWALAWYAKSLDRVADWEDQYRLTGSIDIYLDDPALVRNAYERYEYLKVAGFSPEHPYWNSDEVDHLILMNPDGLVTSDSDGLHVVEERALSDAEFWQWKAASLVYLLPGQYAGAVTADVWQLSIMGLGSPEDTVITAGTENTIVVEAGELHLHDLTVVRENSEDAESFAAIYASGDVTVLVQGCVLKSPGGFAFAAVGDESPRVEIVDCQVVDSANGIYGGAGRTTIDNVTYRDVDGFEARDGGTGLLEVIEDRHRDLGALVDNELFFNLYGFDENWVDPDDLTGYRSKDGGDIFERVYYACALNENMPDELRDFFAAYLPYDFERRMFPKAMGFHAFIGIYNVRTNQMVGIGLGRKDRAFKRVSHVDLDWDAFCELDHAGLASALYDRVEETGRLHGEYLATNDKDEEAELREEMDREWCILRDAVPTLPEDISDVSVISGHRGRDGMDVVSTPEITGGSFDTLISFESSSECADESALESILDGFRQEHGHVVEEFDGFRLRLRIDGQGIDTVCSMVHDRMAKIDPRVSVRSMWDDGETIGVTVTTIGSTQSRSMELSDAARQFMNERGLEGDPDDVDDMGRVEEQGLWDYIYELRGRWIAEIEGAIRGDAEDTKPADDDGGTLEGDSVVKSGETEVGALKGAKKDLFIAPDAPKRFLELANLLHEEGGKRRRKVRAIFNWFGFQRRGVRAIALVSEQFDRARLEVFPSLEDSAMDGLVEISILDGDSPGRYRVLREELEDESNSVTQVQTSPGNPRVIEVPATIADGYLATMAKVLSRGDVVVCSVREVLSWFGVGRRGKRVVDRVMDAFERTHVVTTPPFDEAPIDGHVAIRLREGAKAGEYTVQRPH